MPSAAPTPDWHVLHRPMKLWEVDSAFGRSQPDALRAVLCSEPWRDQYGDAFSNFSNAVASQDRALLDQEVPLALTRELARRSSASFYLLRSAQWGDVLLLRSAGAGSASVDDSRFTEVSAIEVHDSFGGAVIEEVQEHGSAWVTYRRK